MRIYKYLFFLVLLGLGACKSDNENKVPADVISENRMPFICAEMHIVDGNLYNIQQVPDTLYRYSMGHYMAIFKKYHTDTAQFKKSFTWYTRNPIKLDKIYDNVLKILQAKSDSIAKIKVPAPKTPAPQAPLPNAVPAK